MSDGRGPRGAPEVEAPEAPEEEERPRSAPQGGAQALDAYLAGRAAAQSRKIELSMMRKRGIAPSADPQDRALMGGFGQTRTDTRYNPRKW